MTMMVVHAVSDADVVDIPSTTPVVVVIFIIRTRFFFTRA